MSLKFSSDTGVVVGVCSYSHSDDSGVSSDSGVVVGVYLSADTVDSPASSEDVAVISIKYRPRRCENNYGNMVKYIINLLIYQQQSHAFAMQSCSLLNRP